MRNSAVVFASVASGILALVLPTGLAAKGGVMLAEQGGDVPALTERSGPQIPFPPDTRPFGKFGQNPHGSGGNPGVTSPFSSPPEAAKKPEHDVAPQQSRADVLNDLFHRLSEAPDSDAAQGVAIIIEHVWLHSGSDTADLLMTRAVTANDKGDTDLALSLLDKIVVIDPDWAEAWNKRATLRFTKDDDSGAMADVSRVLTLEPRHFGALTGMGYILERHGMKKQALTIFRKAAAIYPHNDPLQKSIDELVPDVEGRGI